jgi:hypothetical protein
MFTEAIQSSRLHRTIHNGHITSIWTGQHCRQCYISCRVRHRATILRRTGRIAGQRRRAPNIPGVDHGPAAKETTTSRYHGVHLLRNLCQEISAVRSSSPTTTSVPVHDVSHRRSWLHFVWPGVQNVCRTWAWACQSCQRSKVTHLPSTPRSTQPRPRHRLSHELHAPDATYVSLLASTSERPSPHGGDMGGTHIESSASQFEQTTAAPTPIGSRAA